MKYLILLCDLVEARLSELKLQDQGDETRIITEEIISNTDLEWCDLVILDYGMTGNLREKKVISQDNYSTLKDPGWQILSKLDYKAKIA